MKSNVKSKIVILITLGIIFALAPKSTINPSLITGNSDVTNLDKENLKLSAVSGKIHIINNSGWLDFRDDGNCTGSGTYSDPYVIKDLVIDGGDYGSTIIIENSNVSFKIENCTVYNELGWDEDPWIVCIALQLVSNGSLINNNVSGGMGYGIGLYNSDNNTISGNLINSNGNGIDLYNSNNNTISGNVMNECGLFLEGDLESLLSNDIVITNLVNGKPLYYYTNEANLEPSNFTNAGQVILVNCHDSVISDLNVSYSSDGILLYYSDNNTISGNTANNNYENGIGIYESNNNNISRNNVNNNSCGIYLHNSDNNVLTENTANYNGNGIRLINSNTNIISGNTANYNYYGIELWESNYNSISGNTANYNEDGIRLTYSNTNILTGNTANYNCYGINLWESNYNSISGNTANYNGDGIRLEMNSNTNFISGNTLNKNGDSGIYLHNTHTNILTGNTANYNFYGINLWESNLNLISGNTAKYNKYGIFLHQSCNNHIINNILTNNTIADYLDNDPCEPDVPSLTYLPIILIISITIVGVSVIIIYLNRKRFRKPQQDVEFL